ncbi:hypothetical protein [Chlorobium phaeobacteroides]|uniref:hypothetical protein n=1 Tax=Chlorobium phaeobacteroides TaxID=1096 RepID=UPI0003120670|nr:hypothetical protein [Chlorobium phaeobacteroides]MBV5319658.1 hypothetical protein [Chlorobium phaeobacteroides]
MQSKTHSLTSTTLHDFHEKQIRHNSDSNRRGITMLPVAVQEIARNNTPYSKQ